MEEGHKTLKQDAVPLALKTQEEATSQGEQL